MLVGDDDGDAAQSEDRPPEVGAVQMRVQDVDSRAAEQMRQPSHLQRVEPVAASEGDEIDAGSGQSSALLVVRTASPVSRRAWCRP